MILINAHIINAHIKYGDRNYGFEELRRSPRLGRTNLIRIGVHIG